MLVLRCISTSESPYCATPVIVISSVAALVVIVMPVPATNVSVSVGASATTSL